MSTAIISTGMIVLNVVSNEIASLLLLGGKTTYSIFCIWLLINEESTCNIAQISLFARLSLKQNWLYGMKHQWWINYALKLFYRILRDIMKYENEVNCQKPCGGKVVALVGDFKQFFLL